MTTFVPENSILDPEESMPREQLRDLQLERLRKIIDYAKARVPFFEKKLAHVNGADVKSLDDLRKLPFTTKQDLRDAEKILIVQQINNFSVFLTRFITSVYFP